MGGGEGRVSARLESKEKRSRRRRAIAHPLGTLGWLPGFLLWLFLLLSPLIHCMLYFCGRNVSPATLRARREALTGPLQRSRLCVIKDIILSFRVAQLFLVFLKIN